MWSQVRAGWLAEVSMQDLGADTPNVQSAGASVAASTLSKASTEQQADSLIAADAGAAGFAGAFDVEISAYVIHAPMHRARPDCLAVLHTHMPHATALSSLSDPTLRMCNLNCLRFFDRCGTAGGGSAGSA